MLKDIILPGEEFKDLEGFEGYAISDMGRVYSYKRGKLLKQQTANDFGVYPNHKYVRIRKDNKYVNVYIHIQVAIAFVPNENNKRHIWHINGNIDDNKATNLIWTSIQYKSPKIKYTEENLKSRLAQHRKPGDTAKKNGKPVICTTYNIEFISMDEAAYVCDLDPRAIKVLCESGEDYFGLKFKYKVRQIRCKELDMVFDSFEEAAKYVDGRPDWIEMCCRGRQKTHKKYHWEFVK